MKIQAWLLFALFMVFLFPGCNTARNRSKEHYALGKKMEREGKTHEAIEEYRTAIKYASDNINAHLAYQNLMVKAGQKSAITEYYRKLKEANPASPAFQYLWGLLLDDREARIDAYRKALTLDPNFLWAFNSTGIEYLDEDHVDDAIKQFHNVIIVDSEFSPVHINLCRAYLKKDKVNAAYNEIKKYLELEPDSADGYEQLGYVYRQKGDEKKAIEAWQKSLELCPNNAKILTETGFSLYALNEYDAALTALQKAWSISPSYPELHYIRGLIYESRGDIGGATDELRISLAGEPDNSKFMEKLGLLLLKTGNTKEGKVVIEKALKSDPDNEEVTLAAGRLYEHEGNRSRARTIYVRALAANPHSEEIRRSLAHLLMQQGESKEALKEYEAIKAHKNNDLEALDRLNTGILYWETGNPDKARKHFLEAIRLDPENGEISLMISLVGEMKGLPGDAASILRTLAGDGHVKELSNEYLGAALLQAHKYDDALKVLTASSDGLRIRPVFHLYVGIALSGKNNYAEALKALKKAGMLNKEKGSLLTENYIHCSIGHTYGAKGSAGEGMGELNKACDPDSDTLIVAKANYEMARICGKAGSKEKALRYLEIAIRSGFHNLALLKNDQAFQQFRKSPELEKLEKKLLGSHS